MSDSAEQIAPTSSNDSGFHPDYVDEGADLVLASSDGKRFCVHTLIMRLASGVLRSMIVSYPEQGSSPNEPINMQEDTETLKALLDIIYPNALPFGTSTMSLSLLQGICHAAEKYEIPKALDAARIYVRASLKDYPPLLAYSLASRYGWQDELRLISTATLSIDPYSSQSMTELQRVPTIGALKLLELHRRRRNLLIECLDLQPSDSESEISAHKIAWHSVQKDERPCKRPWEHFETPCWTVLRHRLLEEMERRSDGSSIRNGSFWDRSEFAKIWESSCKMCYGSSYGFVDKQKLKDEVLRVLDNLPTTI